MKIYLSLLLVLFSAVVGCSAPKDPIVARWSGGDVRQSDIDREVRFMSRDEAQYRAHRQLTDEHTRLDLIRRAALRSIAAEEIAGSAIDMDPEIRAEARQVARTWWLSRWRNECYGLPLDLPEPDELKGEIKQRELPRRLRLSHVFLRAESPDEIETTRTKLGSWRSGIDDLESFADLARTQSDSESRYRGGQLGWIREGWLTPSAEEVLFELEPGTISQPIVMRGGVHLFFIEASREAEVLPLDRQMARLQATKKTEALDRCRSQRLDAARLAVAVDTDAEWPNITIGDWSIESAVLRSLYSESGSDPTEIIDRLVEDEILFQTSIEMGEPDADERLRMDDLEGNVWLTHVVESKVEDTIGSPSIDELRERFNANPTRYRKLGRFEVEVLSTTIPAGVDPMDFWDELTRLSRALGAGQKTFADAATLIGGDAHADRWPMARIQEVAGVLGPVVFDRIRTTPPGGTVGPIQDGPRFFIVAVLDREPARPMTFDEAQPRLRAEILGAWRAAARPRIASEMLANNQFELITPAGSDDALPSGI